MNALFGIIFFFSALILLFLAPDTFLTTLLDGAGKSATLCISLLSTYAVWLGLMNVWEQSGVSRKISRFLRPIARKLFKTEDEKTLDCLCMNMSVNLLGISGAATPYGISAAQRLDKSDNAEYSSAVLLVLNATSLQLIPTSIIGIRTALGSAAPADIVLPTILSTVFSTALGLTLVWLCFSVKHKRFSSVLRKKHRAGAR